MSRGKQIKICRRYNGAAGEKEAGRTPEAGKNAV
nr:MAG TPA: hypothetical protein [Caudoviricetes sp.]